MFKYKTFIEENSLYNTPPCFTIYICMLVTRWIMKVGQENLYRKNVEKAAKIYKIIDSGTFYKGTAVPTCRSDMNITFRLPNEQLEEQFVKDAEKRDLKGLKGHRSVGGVRASIYNAFPMEGVDTLVSFMSEFQKSHG
jgi:phosphoserine aminotransferase